MKAHRRYAGNALMVYCSFAGVAFLIIPIIFAIKLLGEPKEPGTFFLFAMCIFSVIGCGYFLYSNRDSMFTRCEFCDSYIKVKTLFRKPYKIEYSKCDDVGVGCYTHGKQSNTAGINVSYIYLSYNKLPEKYKCNMNMLRPDQTRIKIGFRKKTYEYLKANMPRRQAAMLESSYRALQKIPNEKIQHEKGKNGKRKK